MLKNPRNDILDVPSTALKAARNMNTAELQQVIEKSGLPKSGHKYSAIYEYLEHLVDAGHVRRCEGVSKSAGGERWEWINS